MFWYMCEVFIKCEELCDSTKMLVKCDSFEKIQWK